MGSPAWNMGIQGGDRIATIGGQEITVRGDVVLQIAGIPIRSDADLPRIREKLGTMAPGQPFKATVLRAGQVIVPRGDHTLEVGDEVILFVQREEAGVANLVFPGEESA